MCHIAISRYFFNGLADCVFLCIVIIFMAFKPAIK